MSESLYVCVCRVFVVEESCTFFSKLFLLSLPPHLVIVLDGDGKTAATEPVKTRHKCFLRIGLGKRAQLAMVVFCRSPVDEGF